MGKNGMITVKEKILIIALLSGGELQKDICRDLCSSDRYYDKIMNELKVKEEMFTNLGTKPRTAYIRTPGIERLRKFYPELVDAYTTGPDGKPVKFSHGKRQQFRHRCDISNTVYNMMLAEIPYMGHDDSLFFYAPRVVKSAYTMDAGKAGRGSRMTGLLSGDGVEYITYNTGNSRRGFDFKTEDNMRRIVSPDSGVLFFGDEFSVLQILKENGEMFRKRGLDQSKFHFFTPSELRNVSRGYAIPNGRVGAPDIRMALKPRHHYADLVLKDVDRVQAAWYGFSEDGRRVYDLAPIDLFALDTAFRDSEPKIIFCREEEREMLLEVLPGSEAICCRVDGHGELLER